MKKRAIIFSILLAMAWAWPAGAVELENYNPGLGSRPLQESAMGLVGILLGFLGIIAVIMILYGGFVWLTSAGNEEKVGQAKKILTAAVIGLIIIFMSWAIANFIISALISATGA